MTTPAPRNTDAATRVLGALHGHPGVITVNDVATLTGLPRTTVSSVLSRMIDRRYPGLSRAGTRGTFEYHPGGGRGGVTRLPVPPPPMPRRPGRCPDELIEVVSDKPAKDGSWIGRGDITGRLYKIEEL